MPTKKTAIVYDWIDSWGGVERVLLHLRNMFPAADFYTSYVDFDRAGWAKDWRIRTSFLQNLPDFIKKSRSLSLPLYPYVFESFNFSGYDLVISVTSSFAKSVITKPDTFHLCYLLTPTRYLWLYPEQYLTNWQRRIGRPYLQALQRWDYVAAQRPDKIVAISRTVADRCKKYYGREAPVVYPGFDRGYWRSVRNGNSESKAREQEYYLVVSRLEPYKRIDLAVAVFNRLGWRLIIVGTGTQLGRLKQLAGPNIQFLSGITDQKLTQLYANAQALVMPQEEDFGYVALEARWFGCPVIAYGRGGASETVADGQTGIFFKEQTPTSLRQALEKYDKIKTDLKKWLRTTRGTGFDPYDLDRFKARVYQLCDSRHY
ncbi:glycosyltransferase [Patescibacteria group bacterium]|nr:glycosyltransferase [Patescibacteria group bacterium]MCL5091707.1 glycosyltransferase [Patescibacteria group bacterium]